MITFWYDFMHFWCILIEILIINFVNNIFEALFTTMKTNNCRSFQTS